MDVEQLVGFLLNQLALLGLIRLHLGLKSLVDVLCLFNVVLLSLNRGRHLLPFLSELNVELD